MIVASYKASQQHREDERFGSWQLHVSEQYCICQLSKHLPSIEFDKVKTIIVSAIH